MLFSGEDVRWKSVYRRVCLNSQVSIKNACSKCTKPICSTPINLLTDILYYDFHEIHKKFDNKTFKPIKNILSKGLNVKSKKLPVIYYSLKIFWKIGYCKKKFNKNI